MSLSRREVRRLRAAGFEIAQHDGFAKRAGRFLLWLLTGREQPPSVTVVKYPRDRRSR
jgi:hypothetical protein